METRTQVILIVPILLFLAGGIIGYHLYREWNTPKEITKHYFKTNETVNAKSEIVLEFYSKAGGNITGNISATAEVSLYILDVVNYLEYVRNHNILAVSAKLSKNGTQISIEWLVPSDNYWYVLIYNPHNATIGVSYDVWCRYLS